jgi:hypothetical protein
MLKKIITKLKFGACKTKVLEKENTSAESKTEEVK